MADRLPGVRVKLTTDAGVISAPLFERYPVIIGQGESKIAVTNERVQRDADGTFGSVTSSNASTFNLTTGDTLIFTTDIGGPWTATFTGTPGSVTCANAQAAWGAGIVAGETLSVQVDSGPTQIFTAAAPIATAAELALALGAQLTGCSASVIGVGAAATVRITSDTGGNGSAVTIIAETLGTFNVPGPNFTGGAVVAGVGNVVSIGAVTAAEAIVLIIALGGGGNITCTGTTNITASTVTAGPTGTIQCTGGTSQAKFGFDGLVHTGGSVIDLLANSPVETLVRVGSSPGSSNFTNGVDYQKDIGETGVEWGLGGTEPSAGDYYYVSYTYRPEAATHYEPKLYQSETTMFQERGGYSLTATGLYNRIVAGSHLAFLQNPNGVYVGQYDPYGNYAPQAAPGGWANKDAPTATEMQVSLEALINGLEEIEDTKLYLIPMHPPAELHGTSTANAYLFAHAKTMSAPEYGQERTLIANLDQAADKASGIASARAAALSYSDVRAIQTAPTKWTGSGLGTTEYDNSIFNAAFGGALCAISVGQSMTDQLITGVVTPIKYNKPQKLSLIGRGVAPGVMDGDLCRMLFALTTNTSSAIDEEIMVQEEADFIRFFLRQQLRLKYLRSQSYADAAVARRCGVGAVGILDTLKKDPYNVVEAHKDITGELDSTEPRKIRISGKVKPKFSLVWIDVDLVLTTTL